MEESMTPNTAAAEFNALRTLRVILAFVIRNSLFLVLGPVIGIVLGLLAQLTMSTVYEAKGTFVIDDLPFSQAAKGDAETERTLVQTLILSIPNSDMLRAVEKRTNSPRGKISFTDADRPVSLRGSQPAANITIEARRNSRIGIITTKSQDPQFAADVTNAILEELLRYNLIGGKLKYVALRLNFAKIKADSLLKQMVDLSAERIKLEQQNSELLDYTRQGFPLQGFPAFNTDVTLNNLKTQLILSQSQYDSVASSSTRGDQLLGRRSEVEGLRQQLIAQSSSLAAALRSQLAITRTQGTDVENELKATQEQIQKLEQLGARLIQSFGDPALFQDLSANDAGDLPDSASNVIVIIDRAHALNRPVSPKLWLNLLLGLFFGTAIGVVTAVLVTWFDTRLTSVEAVERLTGLPCLAVLPPIPPPDLSGPSGPQAAPQAVGIGFLRSRLLRNPRDVHPGRVIGFTPSEANQDCSKLVANLAALIARPDRRVLVIDLHFQSPRQARMLGATPAQGLGEWISTPGGRLASFISPTAHPAIGVLAPGHLPERIDLQLSSHPLAPALLELVGVWDFILIDSPNITGDWGLMLALPFGSPLVITAEYSSSTSDHIVAVSRRAQGPKWELLGVVLQDCPEKIAQQHLG
jgi:capsular polysaccharide biosynthesis protein/Mrp family chromosome partitioning ATPase